jgi:hypothetical protein
MTSQGSPYARFRRALKTRNLTIIRAAAAELPRIICSPASNPGPFPCKDG